jgi:hypothetical protein
MRHSATLRGAYLGAAAAFLAIASVPMAAHADELVTFDWVNSSSQGTVTTAPKGFITLDLSNPSVTPTVGGSSFNQAYTSTATWQAALSAFSFTSSDGHTVTKSNVSSITPGTGFGTTWEASSDVAAPFVPTAVGNFLITDFTLAGSAAGMGFTLSFGVGNSPGTMNTPGLSNNSFTPSNGGGNMDSGYWELASVTPVPLPAALPLLVGGLGFIGAALRRKRSLSAA